MTRQGLGSLLTIVGIVAGTGPVLAPSIANAQDDFEKVRVENNRTESQRRARLVRKRIVRVSQQAHWGSQSSPATSTTQTGMPLAGLAAGDEATGSEVSAFSAWTDVTGTVSDNGADSYLVSASVGGDTPLGERLLLGGFASYTYTDTDVRGGAGDSESNGFSIAPYGSLAVTDFLDFDVSAGGAFDRVEVASAPDNDSTSFFVSSNLNAFHYIENFGIRGRVGTVYSDAAIENASNIEFGQLQLGLEGSYYLSDVLGAAWLPSVTFEYNNDYKGTPGGDDDEFIVGGSLFVFSEGNLAGSFDYGAVLDRSNFESHIFSVGLSYRF